MYIFDDGSQCLNFWKQDTTGYFYGGSGTFPAVFVVTKTGNLSMGCQPISSHVSGNKTGCFNETWGQFLAKLEVDGF